MNKVLSVIVVFLFSVSCMARTEDSISVESDSSDFITASLLIMQPDQSSMVSYFGHAALRLQCPSADLDYCFTFDSFASGNYWTLLMGKERTSLIPVTADVFFAEYKSQHRKVYEHELNLTLEEERDLWKLIDRVVDMGAYMQTDYVNHGCAGETASFIASVIKGKLKYPSTIKCLGDTQSEIIGKYLNDNTWRQLMCYIFAAHDIQRPLQNNEEKLMLPTVLEMIWKETTIVDAAGTERPVFSPKKMTVHDAPALEPAECSLFGPDVLTLLLLIFVLAVSLADVFYREVPYLSVATDLLLLTCQTLVGLALTAFLLFSTQPTTCGWNCNIIAFNIVPVCVWIIWKYKCTANSSRMPVYALYSLVLAAFLIYMSVHSVYFDVPQFYLVATLLTRTLCKTAVYAPRIHKFTHSQ